MRLEDEIRVHSFQNKHHRLRVNLLRTVSWLKLQMKAFLDRFDLTQQQFNALQILRESHPKPLSTKEITERMVDHNADTSRVVNRLVRKGLVSKKTSPDDKRLVSIVISKEGKDLLKQIDDRQKDLDDITSRLSQDQVDVLNQLLDELRQ